MTKKRIRDDDIITPLNKKQKTTKDTGRGSDSDENTIFSIQKKRKIH